MYLSPTYLTYSVLITISINRLIPLPEDFHLGRPLGSGFLNTTDKGSEVSFVTNGKFSDKVTEYSAALQMKYTF